MDQDSTQVLFGNVHDHVMRMRRAMIVTQQQVAEPLEQWQVLYQLLDQLDAQVTALEHIAKRGAASITAPNVPDEPPDAT